MNKANFGLIINYGSGLGQYVRKPFKIKAFIDRLFASNPFLCAKAKTPQKMGCFCLYFIHFVLIFVCFVTKKCYKLFYSGDNT